MSNTKIVLNRQSDLILDNAQITAPVGIVKADIPGLEGDLIKLQTTIKGEREERESADLELDGKITTEKGRIDAILDASDADKDSFAEIVALINSVDAENDQVFAGYVLSNDAALAAETSSRVAGDDELTNGLSNEVSRATAAEGSLESALSAEASTTDADFAAMDAAYKAADTAEASTRAAAVTAEESARIAADSSLETKHDAEMSTEVAARIAGDVAEAAAREAAVSTEASARVAEDTSLLERINDEQASRVDADGVLQGNIDVEKGRIDAILDASDADKDSFAEIVALINSVDAENDQVFAGYVLSNDAALSTEVARAESAETSLETELGEVDNNLKSSIELLGGDLEKKINDEKVEREKADAELGEKIADIISNTDITSMDSFSEVSAELEANFSDLSAEIEAKVSTLTETDDSIVNSVDNLSSNVEAFIYDRTPRMIGFNESPDGINDVFGAYVENGTEIVFLNGLMLREGDDYTKPLSLSAFVVPLEITFNSAPAATDKIDVYGVPLGTEFNGTDGNMALDGGTVEDGAFNEPSQGNTNRPDKI
jgi:hypothetical protein